MCSTSTPSFSKVGGALLEIFVFYLWLVFFIKITIFLTLHFVLEFLLYILWRNCLYPNASRVQPDMFSELFCTRERNITCQTFHCILLTGKSDQYFLYRRCTIYSLRVPCAARITRIPNSCHSASQINLCQ